MFLQPKEKTSFRIIEHYNAMEDCVTIHMDVLFGIQQYSVSVTASGLGELPKPVHISGLSFATERADLVRALHGLADKLEMVKTP